MSVLLWSCGRGFVLGVDVVGISAAISAFIWYNLAFPEDGRPMMRGLPKVGGEVASGVGRLWGKGPRTAAGRGTRAERETGDEKIKSEEGR